MEILKPTSYHHNMSSNWVTIGTEYHRSTFPARWTEAENKMFEDALAVYANTPDRWHLVAAMIPGKTVADVIRQYEKLEDDVSSIEAGLVPIPGYKSNFTADQPSPSLSPFRILDWGENNGFKQGFGINGGGKRSRRSDHERKKGIPWTEKEHKLFLLGLKKHGKGDWRSIARNFVITRTSTQVASHAQKFFNRQLSGGKDKRRASIHDITTVNLNENQTNSSPENQNPPPSMLSHQSNSLSGPRFQWDNRSSNGIELGFYQTNRNVFMSPYNGMYPNGSFRFVGAEDMGFEMNSACVYPHG